MENTMENEGIKSNKFLSSYSNKDNIARGPRKDIFLDYNMINSFEIPLPNTQNKLVSEVWKKKDNSDSHILKMRIGKGALFFDAKVAFVVREVLRELTDSIVPADLRPPGSELN